MDLSISAIVPVFNEEKTVGLVVKALLESRLFKEVICVSDGSVDNSKKILESFGNQITFINLPINHGKGYAMAEGVKKADTDLVFFIDADFINLKIEHLEQLIKPLYEDKAEVVICTLGSSPTTKYIFPQLSGQRIYYKKDLLPLLSRIAESRFGVEVLLNEALKKKKTVKVLINDLIHLKKYEKYEPIDALKGFITEGVEIAKEIGNREIVIPSDMKILNKIEGERSLAEATRLITFIKNTKIRSFLKKYFEKYILAAKAKIK